MRSFAIVSFGVLLHGFSSVSARTVFSAVSVDGVDQGHAVGVRVPSSNAPITDITSSDIACNTGFIQPVSDAIIPVNAGDQVTAQFHHYSAGYQGPDPSDPLDPTNKGPVLAYLASVPDAADAGTAGLEWFKIFEDGYTPATRQWASDRLFINGGNATFTIPSCLATGDYLLRAESINLLSASSYPGAQFFMSCAQLHVTGVPSAQAATPATVTFPGAYTDEDPGIVTEIFGISSYTPPGPAVFTC